MIYLDPDSTSVAPLIALYRDDYSAFAPFVKDFVRATVFPRISKLVPSSTREGAEAFLRHLRSNREWFEYELDDKADLEEVLEELRAGRMTVVEATRRLTDSGRSFVEVSSAGTESLSTVVSEIGEESAEEVTPDPFEARPGIDRREEETKALILTSEVPVNGYTCFLALSDRVQRERGDFFLQPHTTEVVWGGKEGNFYIPAPLRPVRIVLRYPLSRPCRQGVKRWPKGDVNNPHERPYVYPNTTRHSGRFPA